MKVSTFGERLQVHPGSARERLLNQYGVPAALLLLALALRLFRLGDWSYWGDEFFTVSGREDGFNYSILRRSLASDLIHLAIRLLGPEEWAARLVPAIIGALTVPLLYFLLKPIAPKGVPFLAALLLAISPWHLYWSQNARFYTLLLAFSGLSLIFYYRGLEEDRPLLLLGALLFLGLATRERLVALLLVPVFALYPLLLWLLRFDRPAGLRWSRLLIFFSPLLFGAALFVLPYALRFPQWMANFGTPTNSPLGILAGVVVYLTVPLTCLAAFGGARLILLKNRQGLFFTLAAGVPVLLMMVISLFHYAANRYVFFALIGCVILAAWAVQDLYDQLAPSAKILAVGVLAVLVAACLAGTGFYYFELNGNRQDWKGALHYIRQNARPGDQVIAIDLDLAEYYLGQRPTPYEFITWREGLAPRAWVVEEEGAWKSFPEEVAWIREHARLMRVFDVVAPGRLFPMRVYLLTSPADAGQVPTK